MSSDKAGRPFTHSYLLHCDALLRIFLKKSVYQIREVGVLFVLETQIIVPDDLIEIQKAVLFKRNVAVSQTEESDAHNKDV